MGVLKDFKSFLHKNIPGFVQKVFLRTRETAPNPDLRGELTPTALRRGSWIYLCLNFSAMRMPEILYFSTRRTENQVVCSTKKG